MSKYFFSGKDNSIGKLARALMDSSCTVSDPIRTVLD